MDKEHKKGWKLSAETRRKQGVASRRRWADEDYRETIRLATVRAWQDDVYRKTIIDARHRQAPPVPKGTKFSDEHRRKIGEGNRGKLISAEARKKIGVANRGKTRSIEERKRMGDAQRGRRHTPETRNKMSVVRTRLWQNPEVARKTVVSWGATPTKPESVVNVLLNEELPNEYAINTRAEIMVLGGKIPDFVNVSGQKKLIELWGDYWHRRQNPQDRIDYFKQFGYDTLVLWEHELKDLARVKMRLRQFTKGDS